MNIFGWMCMIALMAFGLFVLGILVGPFVVAKIKSFIYKVKRLVEDEKIDIDKRSEEKRIRADKKRLKDFELADKKLDAKLNKVNKKVKIYEEKIKLAEELDKITTAEKVNTKETEQETHLEPEIDTASHESNSVEENIENKE